ncbi:hypothetical protein ACOXXX_02240 [Thalassococcus sp. BH17M4-6]|uniref:hypothetical protein n=1 Tax=Thalassococcus sp. BH17M4-6 TaxID=3413148 RepID=UPI003BDBAB7F
MMRQLTLLALALAAAPAFGQGFSPQRGGQQQGQGQLTIDTAPAQVLIDRTCTFSTECYEAESCTDTGFDITLQGDAGGMDMQSMVLRTRLISDAGTVEMLGVQDSGAMSLSGGTFEARHLLTVNAEGAARYSVHYIDGPMVVTYLGTCEGE